MEPPWGGGTKVCLPPCPYMVNLKKSSSPEPKSRWFGNLVCSIGCSSTTKFVQMMTWYDTWPRWLPAHISAHIWIKPSKISFFETKQLMILELGIQHRVLKYYQICSNDNTGLTLTKQWIFQKLFVYDLKLAIDDRSDKKFLLTSKLCPLGAVRPLPQGYIYIYIKSWKKLYIIRLQRDFFDTCNKCEVIRPFCWHQNFVPWGLSALALGLYTCIKSWKDYMKSDFKEIFWNLQQMTKSTRCSCWHKNFIPKGLSAPALGLYTCIKSWKKMYEIRLQRDFFLNL